MTDFLIFVGVLMCIPIDKNAAIHKRYVNSSAALSHVAHKSSFARIGFDVSALRTMCVPRLNTQIRVLEHPPSNSPNRWIPPHRAHTLARTHTHAHTGHA